MQRAELHRRLSHVKRLVDDAEIHITRQKRVIRRLVSAGLDTGNAEKILQTFEETLALHFAEMQSIVNYLDSLRREAARVDAPTACRRNGAVAG